MSSRTKGSWGLLIAVAGVVAIGVSIFAGLYFSRIPMRSYDRTWELLTLNHPAEVRLIVVGDSGSGDENQRFVAAAMERKCADEKPDAVILLGDNFYVDGVADVQDSQWRTKFSEMYRQPCLSSTPFAAVLGNHDYHQNPQAQVDYTKVASGKWIMPGRSFVIRAPGVLNIAMIDSNFPDRCYLGICSLDKVLQDLSQQPASWTIVAGHHPLFSGGKYRRMKMLPGYFVSNFYCDAGASMYWSGHDHNLQLLRGQDGNLPCAVNQLIAGGGGASLYPAEMLPGQTEFAATKHGFAVARIRAETINMQFFGVDGATDSAVADLPLHEFTLTKQ
jgi:tartrate-resistant acid phosphatase type 5